MIFWYFFISYTFIKASDCIINFYKTENKKDGKRTTQKAYQSQQNTNISGLDEEQIPFRVDVREKECLNYQSGKIVGSKD